MFYLLSGLVVTVVVWCWHRITRKGRDAGPWSQVETIDSKEARERY